MAKSYIIDIPVTKAEITYIGNDNYNHQGKYLVTGQYSSEDDLANALMEQYKSLHDIKVMHFYVEHRKYEITDSQIMRNGVRIK